MKKTTKILIASLVVVVIGSFFSPLMMGHREDERHPVTFNPIGTLDTIRFERPIDAVKISTPMSSYVVSNTSAGLNLIIEESDAIASPYLVADKSWCQNMEAVYAGTLLNLTYPMTAALKENPEYSYMNIPQNNQSLGILVVPTGTLHEVESPGVNITLKSFHDADIALNNVSGFTCSNCSFSSITNH